MPTNPAMGEAVRYLLGLQELVRAPDIPGFGPAILPSGGSTPTIVIAASNTNMKTQLKADYVCPIPDATETLRTALQDLFFRGGGRLVFTEGDFYLPQTINITGPSVGYRFEGMGQLATRLHSGFNSFLTTPSNQTMFNIDHSAGTGITGSVHFQNMTLDGHKSIQSSGAPVAIYIEPNGSYPMTFTDMTIKNWRGNGMWFDRCADLVNITRCVIEGNTGNGIYLQREGSFKVTDCEIRNNTGYGFSGEGAFVTMKGNHISNNTAGGFWSAGNLQQPGQVIVGNQFDGNTGPAIDLTGFHLVIADNFVAWNTAGISVVVSGHQNLIANNVLLENVQNAITLNGGAGSRGGICEGNQLFYNGRHGIEVLSNNWLVQGNHIDSNSHVSGNGNTYDGINVAGDDCDILCNMIRQDGSGNKQRYGINILAAAANTWVAGNDASRDGMGTGAYNDAGAGTQNVWAGTFGDNY